MMCCVLFIIEYLTQHHIVLHGSTKHIVYIIRNGRSSNKTVANSSCTVQLAMWVPGQMRLLDSSSCGGVAGTRA